MSHTKQPLCAGVVKEPSEFEKIVDLKTGQLGLGLLP